jgi:hypothetical protein
MATGDDQRPDLGQLEPERARTLAVGRLRRMWVDGNDELEHLALANAAREPSVIYDLDGRPLFYDFELSDGERAVGVARAAASPAIGTGLVATELRPRSWDPKAAIDAARKSVGKQGRDVKVTDARLVCYCYPKIGVLVTYSARGVKRAQTIIDVSDGLPVVNLGADEPEGSTAYSYYAKIVEPALERRSRRWARTVEDDDLVVRAAPELLDVDRPLKLAERPKFRDALLAEYLFIEWPFSQSKVITFGPRCDSHECFELYAQQTNVYCAVATGQMILDFYRWPRTQDQIAAAMGTDSGGTSQTGQIDGYESISHHCLDATLDTTANWSEARAEIDANRPLKSGIPGHARAVAGWMKTWSWSSFGYDYSLKVYDPWPWNADICSGGAIVWEDWDAVNHTNFIYVRQRTTDHD